MRLSPLLLVVLAASALPALGEKADRTLPMVVEADKPGSADLKTRVVVFNGNVSISQGTMQIRAERVEVSESGEGFRSAQATGSAARQATFRQKRDGVDEWVEAAADRIEYDAKADTLRFVGRAVVRRLRGSAVADEITGGLITWDNRSEQFAVQAGAQGGTAGDGGGRVRAVLSPRGEAASPPASAPASPPASPKK
jgi:lipopolysaccharide export system protein LptA